MKVLIMSDSHGLTHEISMIKQRHKHEVAGMIHCGDSELPSQDRQMQDFLAVRGNCDFDVEYPDQLIKEYGDFRLFATHGHLYNVKMTLMSLAYKAEEEQAHIVCFGHSHIAGSELVNGRLFINPGSIRLPQRRTEKTYVILEIDGKDAKVSFYDVDGNLIEDLTETYHFN